MSIFKYLKKYWLWAILAPLFMVGEVMMDLLQPVLMSVLVDNGINGAEFASDLSPFLLNLYNKIFAINKPIKIKSNVLIVLNLSNTKQTTTPIKYIKLTGARFPLKILSDITPAQTVPARFLRYQTVQTWCSSFVRNYTKPKEPATGRHIYFDRGFGHCLCPWFSLLVDGLKVLEKIFLILFYSHFEWMSILLFA